MEDTTNNGEGIVPAGLSIALTAAPDEGYAFVRWDITGGTVKDAASADTVFIMPPADATVIAVFGVAVLPPPTGDGTPLALYAGLMLLALTCVIAVLRRRMAR